MTAIYTISSFGVETLALVMLALWGYALFAPKEVSPVWRIGSAAWGFLLFIVFMSITG